MVEWVKSSTKSLGKQNLRVETTTTSEWHDGVGLKGRYNWRWRRVDFSLFPINNTSTPELRRDKCSTFHIWRTGTQPDEYKTERRGMRKKLHKVDSLCSLVLSWPPPQISTLQYIYTTTSGGTILTGTSGSTKGLSSVTLSPLTRDGPFEG